MENSRRVSEYFLKKIEDWTDRYPFVGDLRGLGLFIGMDLLSQSFCIPDRAAQIYGAVVRFSFFKRPIKFLSDSP